MRRAFIVHIDIPDTSSVDGVAEDVKDILLDEGYMVHDVKAWSSPAQQFSVANPNQNPQLPPQVQ